jgi:hypothetical protein
MRVEVVFGVQEALQPMKGLLSSHRSWTNTHVYAASLPTPSIYLLFERVQRCYCLRSDIDRNIWQHLIWVNGIIGLSH